MARKAYNGYTEKSYYDNTKFSGVVASTDALNEGNFKEMINLDISDTGASVKPRKGFLTTTVYCPDFEMPDFDLDDVVQPTDIVYTEYTLFKSNGDLANPSYTENKLQSFTNFRQFDFDDHIAVNINNNNNTIIFLRQNVDDYVYVVLTDDYKYYTYKDGKYVENTTLENSFLTTNDTYYISNDGKNFTCIVYDGLPYTYEAQILSVDLSRPTESATHAGNITAKGYTVVSSTPVLVSSDKELDKEYVTFEHVSNEVPKYWSVFEYDKDIDSFNLPNITAIVTYNADIKYLSYDGFTINIKTTDYTETSETNDTFGNYNIIKISLAKINFFLEEAKVSNLFDDTSGIHTLLFKNSSDETLANITINGYFKKDITENETNSLLSVNFTAISFMNENYNTLKIYLESDDYTLIAIKSNEFKQFYSGTLYNCSSNKKYNFHENLFDLSGNISDETFNISSIQFTNFCCQLSSGEYLMMSDTDLIGGYVDDKYYINKNLSGFLSIYVNMYANIYAQYKSYKIPEIVSAYIKYDTDLRKFYIENNIPKYVDCSYGTQFIGSTDTVYVVNKPTKEFIEGISSTGSVVSKVTLQNMNSCPTYFRPFILDYNNAQSIIDLTDVKVPSCVGRLILPDACTSIPTEFTKTEDAPDLFSVKLPYCCTEIGTSAFKDCTNLFEIILNDKLEIIQASAFENCNLRGDIVFNNYLYISDNAFVNACKEVSSITFNKDAYIVDAAFTDYTGIVYYPKSQQDFSTQAFRNATLKPFKSITFTINSDVVCLKYKDSNVKSYTVKYEDIDSITYIDVQLQVLNNLYIITDVDDYEYISTLQIVRIFRSDEGYADSYVITPDVKLVNVGNQVTELVDVIVHRSGIYTLFINRVKEYIDNDISVPTLTGYVYTNMDTDILDSKAIYKYILTCDNTLTTIDTSSVINYCMLNNNIYHNPEDVLNRLYIPNDCTRVTSPMLNEYGITRGILRAYYRNGGTQDSITDPQILLAFTYRKDAVIGNGTEALPQYPANSLIIEVVDTQTQYSVDNVNLASKRSIIPDDVDKQRIYTPEELLENNINGFVNSLNFVYTRNNENNKYLIKYTKDLNFTLIPSFTYLNELKQGRLELDLDNETGNYIIRLRESYNNDLLYTYKITSTLTVPSDTETEVEDLVYYGPVCKLTDNENVSEFINYNGDYDQGVDSVASLSASHASIFSIKDVDGMPVLMCDFGYAVDHDPNMIKLKSGGFFTNGLNLEFSVIYAPFTAYKDAVILANSVEIRNIFASSMSRTSLDNLAHANFPVQMVLTLNPSLVTYIDTIMTNSYDDILHADGMIIFKPVEGDRLVVWKDNILYMTKANSVVNTEGFFDTVFTFDEPIIKAITYKTLILVFTTQTLYAVYPYTDVMSQEETNEEGETTIKQVEYTAYAKLPVLYNIMCNKQYSDAIQVYNQMILFYSSDGQMFLIKPSTTIDSDTRFTLQYFNKSVNDVLLNYDEYINERVKYYGIDLREKYPECIDAILDGTFKIPKKDINIKVQSNINYIKIYYCVPGVITYILVYNVLNNYWYMYDTVSFTDIREIMYIQSGDLFLTNTNNVFYFTFTYTEVNNMDNNCDMSIYNNFSKEPIRALLDTGTLSLNNHLRKRFRNLRITYKNINASTIKYNLDIIVDDALVDSNLQSTSFDIKDLNGSMTMFSVTSPNYINLLEDRTLLFDVSSFTSDKLLTYITNIPNMGHAIRFKIYLESKGIYKLMSYGLVYKERTV